MDLTDKKFLTIEETAKIIGVSITTIRRWMDREYNPIPFKNFARPERPSWKISKKDLTEWIKSLPDPRTDV